MAGTLTIGRRVLVTGGDYLGALAAVRALRAAGHEPWVTITSSRSYAARSRAPYATILAPDPLRDESGFLSAVADANRRLGFGAILCGAEQDLIALSTGSELLGAQSDREQVLDVTSKSLVYEIAAQVGLAIPRTREARRGEITADGLSFPVVIKPARSVERVAGELVRYEPAVADTPERLTRLLEDAPERVLLQERLDGPVAAVAGVAWHGEIIASLHQVADRIWPPAAGSSAYARTVPRDRTLEARVGELVRRLNWSGIFQLQFIRCASGPHLIDLNPRIYGTLALASRAGLNLPAILVSLLHGEVPAVAEYAVDARFRSEEKDLLALMRLLRRGEVGSALTGMVPRRNTAHAVSTLLDPAPLLTSLQKARARARVVT